MVKFISLRGGKKPNSGIVHKSLASEKQRNLYIADEIKLALVGWDGDLGKGPYGA